MPLQAGTRLGAYEILGPIGAGGMGGKIHARQGRLDECARIEAELEDRRGRGEYIPRACDVIIATGRDDIPAFRRALRACIDEQTNWLTVRIGPGPSLERYRADAEIDALLEEIYDGAHACR